MSLFSLRVVYHREDAERQQDVHDDAGRYYQHPCGKGLRAEFPGLGLVLQMLGIETFIHHACDLYVAANGNPRDAVISLADLLSKRARGKADGKPVNPHSHELGGKEMPQLVYKDQHAEREHKIKY